MEALKMNNDLLDNLHQCLMEMGYRFNKEVTVHTTGRFTTALYNDTVSPFLLDEEVKKLNYILPDGLKAHKHRDMIRIVVTSFINWQLSHYSERLSEANTPEEKSFLRQTLHGLTKSNTDDNTIPSFDYFPAFATTQF